MILIIEEIEYELINNLIATNIDEEFVNNSL
jgi:hypothetical protein